jgi:hypothetical protein
VQSRCSTVTDENVERAVAGVREAPRRSGLAPVRPKHWPESFSPSQNASVGQTAAFHAP